ncbi:MFS general substrate transporter [Peniophora sp. CONT]|nr:MFS general substrate transporter [Peniophora sp. CONT]
MASLPSNYSRQRLTVLAASALVALSSGTNYVVSAYAPQLGSRLHLTHTELNIVTIAGNFGVYISGPFTGRIMDSRGPRPLLIVAFIALLCGYLGIRATYDRGLEDGEKTLSRAHLFALIFCSYLTGMGGNSAMSTAMNSTAKSFPDSSRAVVVGIVMSGFGLSAFLFSTISHILFPGNTSDFLLVLALGTALPMVLGFFVVRPIPLPPHQQSHIVPSSERNNGTPAYRRVSFDGAPAAVRANSMTRLLSPAPLSSSLLEDETSDGHYTDTRPALAPLGARSPSRAHLLSDSVQLTPGAENLMHRSASRGSRVREVVYEKVHEGRGVDMHGLHLFKSADFWIACFLNVMFSGTGIMYINNVGSIAQALFAQGNPSYDQTQAAAWQAAQVSTISVMNFAGRLAIGVAADITKQRFGRPRSFCMTGVAALFIISQLVLINTGDVGKLWIASACLGFAYGSLFGLLPTLTIEWFGLAHFSENWGFISLFPVVGGNLFSLAFGRNLDAHSTPQASEVIPALATSALNAASSLLGNGEKLSARGGLPSDDGPQCFDGRICYIDSVYLTLGACTFALSLAVWAGYRDWHDAKEKHEEDMETVLWEEDEEEE